MKKTSLKKFLKEGCSLSSDEIEFDSDYLKSLDRCEREQDMILRSKVVDREVFRLVVNI